jgi:hypothetical protein
MSNIDRQRIDAVRIVERLGYGLEWMPPTGTPAAASPAFAEADAMHALLVLRADKLGGCTEGSARSIASRQARSAARSSSRALWTSFRQPNLRAVIEPSTSGLSSNCSRA